MLLGLATFKNQRAKHFEYVFHAFVVLFIVQFIVTRTISEHLEAFTNLAYLLLLYPFFIQTDYLLSIYRPFIVFFVVANTQQNQKNAATILIVLGIVGLSLEIIYWFFMHEKAQQFLLSETLVRKESQKNNLLTDLPEILMIVNQNLDRIVF